jgi:hypothetical protein
MLSPGLIRPAPLDDCLRWARLVSTWKPDSRRACYLATAADSSWTLSIICCSTFGDQTAGRP